MKEGTTHMTLGQKIKRIRTFRNMTQQELGEAIGLDAKGAANRIAQYETNYRVPKKEMLLDMSKALNVSYLNFYTPEYGSSEDIMQTLFWLDEDNRDAINLFSLTCTNKKEKSDIAPNIEYENNSAHLPDDSPIGMWFNYGLVDEFMREWMNRKNELKNGNITDNEYLEWKLNWPNTSDDCGEFEPKKGWKEKIESRTNNR